MKYIAIISVSLIMFMADQSVAQATYEGNDNGGPPNSYIGWDNGVTDPLEIRHDAFEPILFSTNTDERMRIAEFGNISVGGDASPNQKFAVRLAAIAPSLRSLPARLGG